LKPDDFVDQGGAPAADEQEQQPGEQAGRARGIFAAAHAARPGLFQRKIQFASRCRDPHRIGIARREDSSTPTVVNGGWPAISGGSDRQIKKDASESAEAPHTETGVQRTSRMVCGVYPSSRTETGDLPIQGRSTGSSAR